MSKINKEDRKIIRVLLVLILVMTISIQSKAQHHDHHGHHHSRNEIGLSGGALYSLEHKEWGVGTHLHYYRTLGDHSKWALGAMAEYAYVHGSHFTLGAGAKYQLTEKLGIGVLPGITFLQHDDDAHVADYGNHENKAIFSTHFELVYDLFYWNGFHFGPVIDYSWSKNDSHGMIGIHAAYCF